MLSCQARGQKRKGDLRSVKEKNKHEWQDNMRHNSYIGDWKSPSEMSPLVKEECEVKQPAQETTAEEPEASEESGSYLHSQLSTRYLQRLI